MVGRVHTGSRSNETRGGPTGRIRRCLIAVGVAALVGVPIAGLASPATAASHLKAHYVLALSGANQVSPVTTNGSGMAKVKVDGTSMTVCVRITVSNITLPATGAHIHQGTTGTNGPIVISLSPPTGKKPNATRGKSSTCVTNVSPTLISGLINNPSDFYVNVHTTDFPAGVIRGQLA
jgi:hypothetical protein